MGGLVRELKVIIALVGLVGMLTIFLSVVQWTKLMGGLLLVIVSGYLGVVMLPDKPKASARTSKATAAEMKGKVSEKGGEGSLKVPPALLIPALVALCGLTLLVFAGVEGLRETANKRAEIESQYQAILYNQAVIKREADHRSKPKAEADSLSRVSGEIAGKDSAKWEDFASHWNFVSLEMRKETVENWCALIDRDGQEVLPIAAAGPEMMASEEFSKLSPKEQASFREYIEYCQRGGVICKSAASSARATTTAGAFHEAVRPYFEWRDANPRREK